MTKLADLVHGVVLMGNTLLIQANRTALADGLCVDAQGQPVAVSPIDDNDLVLADLPVRRLFAYPTGTIQLTETLPASDNAAEVAFKSEGHVNLLPDWTLENGQTLQIRIDAADQPRRIDIEHPLVVPAADRPLQFEAHVAAHRCKASLVVRFEPTVGGQTEEVQTNRPPPHRWRLRCRRWRWRHGQRRNQGLGS